MSTYRRNIGRTRTDIRVRTPVWPPKPTKIKRRKSMGFIAWIFLAKFLDWHTNKENTPDNFMKMFQRILFCYFGYYALIVALWATFFLVVGVGYLIFG